MFSFFKQSIEKVVADLEAKVVTLEQLSLQHAKEAEEHAILAVKAEANKLAASQLAQRAVRIGAKIKELIS